MKPKKKMETSKKLLYWSVGQFIAISAVSCVAGFMLHDVTPFIYLIPASSTVIGLTIPFYMNKSKAENTQGGIVHDTAMAQLQAGISNDESSV